MLGLIKRNTPLIADQFIYEICPRREGKQFCEYSASDGKILLRGESKISLAMAYYDYLKAYCRVNLSHCGNTALCVSQAPLPTETHTRIIEQEKRVYLNYCTFGYSMRSWQWDKWEKELDFMAMNGINMPLSVVGTEAVMFYTLQDFGMSEKDALAFIAGPSYYPWQMMTNLDSFLSVPDKAYIDRRLELGKKILEREISLGMTPIEQGFAGHIPAKLAELFGSRPEKLPTWCGFPGTVQLDPLDENFTKFGTALLTKQKELLGAYHYYACDPFHENEPPVDGDDYLADVGRTISDMLTAFDSEAVWVMQGWSLREKIVKAVDKKRLLILDLDGSKSELYKGFWGYSYICGTLHNFGDRNSLHGSIDLLAENQYTVRKDKYPGEVGTGLFMEGFFQNPLYYDLAFTMLTEKDRLDPEPWLTDYAQRRYGSDEACLKKAVSLLHESCYSEKCTGRETGSIICARPSTVYYHTAPNDHTELRYDNKLLCLALMSLLQAKNACTDGYLFDLCDVARQYLSNRAKEVYYDIMKACANGDKDLFEEKVSLFIDMVKAVDELLSTRPELTLSEHVREAMEHSCCEKHRDIFRRNELTLLTIWGPREDNELFDYAWKEWGGLIGRFYLPRWEMFFGELRSRLGGDISDISTTALNHNERNDYDTTPFQKKLRDFEFSFIDSYQPENSEAGDTLAAVRKICDRFCEESR
ncbi:MAG: alpha-N-acetylglucosaminidase [Oscillospiraceae bacterium]|nr:alpha-N-acetylglucosaminidase [Oscillospiraceae bacterium]